MGGRLIRSMHEDERDKQCVSAKVTSCKENSHEEVCPRPNIKTNIDIEDFQDLRVAGNLRSSTEVVSSPRGNRGP